MNGHWASRALRFLPLLLLIGSISAQAQETVTIFLGTSGATLTLTVNADGSYGLSGASGIRSVSFEDGVPQEAVSANGNTYSFRLDEDGKWLAEFVAPEPQTVQLGDSGSVQIALAEDGTWTIGGQAVQPGGTWTADGIAYRLVLGDDGIWTASLAAPEVQTVKLGTSGASVTFTRAEDGTHSITGLDGVSTLETDPEGNWIAVAPNGNRYKLTIQDGSWMAEFLAPDAQKVQLGSSGSVEIRLSDDGTFSIDGKPVMSGDTWETPDGSVYELVLDENGKWSATPQAVEAQEVSVKLGASGDSVTVSKAADGSYRLGSTAIDESSAATVKAANGNTYTVRLNADGTLVAEFVAPKPVVVRLGSSGDEVSITMDEMRRFSIDGQQILHLGTHKSKRGNEYRLEHNTSTGLWTATYLPQTMKIVGTELTLTTKEVGGYQIGTVDLAALPDAGVTIDLAVDGRTYRVWTDGSALRGELYDLPPNTDRAFYSGQLTEAYTEAEGTRLRVTHENADGFFADFSIGDLLGSTGQSFQRGETFTAAAKDAIQDMRGDAAAVLSLQGVLSPDDIQTRLRSLWTDATDQVASVLGAGHLSSRVPAEDDFLARIDSVITALSSVAEFQQATAGGGGGVFETAGFSADRAAEVFGAAQGEATITFGTTGSTRYGAVSYMARTDAVSDLEHVLESGQVVTHADGRLLKGLSVDYDGAAVRLRAEWGSAVQSGRIDPGDLGDGPFVDAVTDLPDLRISRGSGLRDNEQVSVQVNGADLEVTVTGGRAGSAGVTSSLSGFTGNVQQTAVSNARALGALGTFAYSTDPATFARRDLSTSGSASYAGGTRAVGGDGTLYEGEIEILVRFSTKTVHGLVKNMTRLQDGFPWQYLSEDAQTISLPEATLAVNGTWNTTPGEQAQLTYGSGFIPKSAVVDGTFRGSLVGSNPAGREAVGSWTIDGSGTIALLAGGFGATFDIEDPTVGLPIDPSSVGASSLPAGTAIEDGKLQLTTNQYGWNLVGTPPNSVWTYGAKRDGLQVLERTYEIELDDLHTTSASQVSVNGTNPDGQSTHVEQVRAQIEQMRSDLADLIAISDQTPALVSLQQQYWKQLQDLLQTSLFTQVPGALAGDYDATRAPGLIDRALKALESDSALREALDPSLNGIFTVNRAPVTTRDPAEIFGQAESQINLWVHSTALTRFGAWRLQTSPRAADENWQIQSGKKDGPNSFAYSTLPAARIAGVDSFFYAPGYLATYSGSTVAVQGENFYTGKVELSVAWDRNSVGAQLAATLSSLENTANGEFLTYLYDDGTPTLATAEVGELTLRGIAVSPDSGTGELVFSAVSGSAGSPTVTLSATDFRTNPVNLPDQGTRFEGAFAGQSEDGPLGVVGRWEIRTGVPVYQGGAYDIPAQVGDGTRIFGAFGAELTNP